MDDVQLNHIHNNLRYRKKSITLFAEGVNLYLEYLKRYLNPHAQALQLKFAAAGKIFDWLKSLEASADGEWDMVHFSASNETLQTICSCLPYLVERINKDIADLMSYGAPPEAIEHLNDKVEQIKALLNLSPLAELPLLPIMGENAKHDAGPAPKVFYSWQSDNKSARNKIKSALQGAVKLAGKELSEANRPELDSDVRGTHASVNIVDTIFNKIDECAVFVADVTPIASSGEKLVPNPNVMAELGYALKTKSDRSLFIYICDDERAERNMPFDIGGKSVLRFSTSDKPSDMAKVLAGRVQGILITHQNEASEPDEYPHIYVCGGAFQQSTSGATLVLTIRNSEASAYTLTAIEIEGSSAEPFRSLEPNAVTRGIALNGITQIFNTPEPLIQMTVTRANKSYRLEQKILTVRGADERNHFERFVEQPILVRN